MYYGNLKPVCQDFKFLEKEKRYSKFLLLTAVIVNEDICYDLY